MTLKPFPLALPFVLIASALLGNALAPVRASACSCMVQGVEDAQRSASVIVEGRVTRVLAPTTGDAEADLHVTVQVVRSFGGTTGESLELKTAGSSASCGYGFEQGKSYLIYASTEAGAHSVSLCSRTKPIEHAGEDLAVLGMGVTPFDPGPGSDQKTPPSDPGGASPSGHNTRGGCASCAVGAAPMQHAGSSRAQHANALRNIAALFGLLVLLCYRITYRRRSESPL